MDLLPEDLLAGILRRLPPCPLAVCRSVSKSLLAIIDSHGLLAAGRVPRTPRGVFINYISQDRPFFFSRWRPRAAAPPPTVVDGELGFLPEVTWGEVVDHCNGLLLYRDEMARRDRLFVCNPATRRWAELPPLPRGSGGGAAAAHLVFDPTISLDYEVISFPEAPTKPRIPIQPGIRRTLSCQRLREYTFEEIKQLPSTVKDKYDREAAVEGSVEWPPSSYLAQVFSSRTGRWEERAYVREDDVAVTLMDVWSELDLWAKHCSAPPRCSGVCWRGAFYLHCRGGFVMR